MAARQFDGGDSAAGDGGFAVVAERPTRHTWLLAQERLHIRSGDRAELGVDGDLPGLSIEPGRVHQSDQVGAEDERGSHGGHCHRSRGQGASHRNCGATPARLEREARSYRDARRGTRPGKQFQETRWPFDTAPGHRSLRSGGLARLAPQRSSEAQREHDDDNEGAAPHDEPVDGQARVWFGHTSRPDRHQRRQRSRHQHCHGGADDDGDADLRQRHRPQLCPRHTERPRRRVVGGGDEDLTKEDLADDQYRGERDQEREQRQSHRLGFDGLLDLRCLLVQVDHEELTPGLGVQAHQGLDGAPEARDGDTVLQPDER
jgi:hypothetical protein